MFCFFPLHQHNLMLNIRTPMGSAHTSLRPICNGRAANWYLTDVWLLTQHRLRCHSPACTVNWLEADWVARWVERHVAKLSYSSQLQVQLKWTGMRAYRSEHKRKQLRCPLLMAIFPFSSSSSKSSSSSSEIRSDIVKFTERKINSSMNRYRHIE